MDRDAKKFVDLWIAENIRKSRTKSLDENDLAYKLTLQCWKEANALGFSRMNLDHATNGFTTYMHSVVVKAEHS